MAAADQEARNVAHPGRRASTTTRSWPTLVVRPRRRRRHDHPGAHRRRPAAGRGTGDDRRRRRAAERSTARRSRSWTATAARCCCRSSVRRHRRGAHRGGGGGAAPRRPRGLGRDHRPGRSCCWSLALAIALADRAPDQRAAARGGRHRAPAARGRPGGPRRGPGHRGDPGAGPRPERAGRAHRPSCSSTERAAVGRPLPPAAHAGHRAAARRRGGRPTPRSPSGCSCTSPRCSAPSTRSSRRPAVRCAPTSPRVRCRGDGARAAGVLAAAGRGPGAAGRGRRCPTGRVPVPLDRADLTDWSTCSSTTSSPTHPKARRCGSRCVTTGDRTGRAAA